MSEFVLFEIKDRIAYITLNRPEALNALNTAMTQRLRLLFTEINENPEVLVAIINANGDRAFSTGRDLKELASDGFPEGEGKDKAMYPHVVKPVIAAIHGFCVAGGFEISLRCDIRIATPDAQFGLPEPRWSLLAGYGLHNLSRMIPLGEALLMQLSGERISAQRAYEIGLIQRLVAKEHLMEEARKIADSIVLNAPLAVQAIKSIVMTGRNLPVEYSMKLALPLQEKIYASEDFHEGPKAFTEKRRPVWKSR
jgi:enoyl-CoA hydratase/carnithine racemase